MACPGRGETRVTPLLRFFAPNLDEFRGAGQGRRKAAEDFFGWRLSPLTPVSGQKKGSKKWGRRDGKERKGATARNERGNCNHKDRLRGNFPLTTRYSTL